MNRTADPSPAPGWSWALCAHCHRKKIGQIAPGQTISDRPASDASTALWCRNCKQNSYVVPATARSA